MKMPFKKTGQVFIYALILGSLLFIGCRTGGLHQKYSDRSKKLTHFQSYTSVHEYVSHIFANRTAIYNLENRIEQANNEARLFKGLKYVYEYCPPDTKFKNLSSREQVLKKDKEIESWKKELEELYNETSHVEWALRKKGKKILQEIEGYKALKKAEDSAKPEKYAEIANNEHEKEQDMKQIEKTISFTGNDLIQTFDDYEQYFFKFTGGYEYATINKIFDEGHPRLGFMVYMRRNDPNYPDGYHGWDWYGLHTSLTAQLTGSAESRTVFTNASSIRNLGDKKAFEFELPVFIPLYRSEKMNSYKLWEYAGIIGTAGGRKIDEDKRFDLRYYGGLRFAINPELYADIMYGKTESLRSQRVELRGQLPVYKLDEGSRVFLGAIGNIAIGKRRDEEEDILRVFLTFNVDFKDIFGNEAHDNK